LDAVRHRLQQAERPGAVGAQAELHEGEQPPLDVGHPGEHAHQDGEEHQHLDGADRDLLLERRERHVAAMTPAFAFASAFASSNVFATRRQQPFSRTWYSYSSRYFRSVVRGGVMAASPNAQTVLPAMESQTSARISRSRSLPRPSSI